MLGSASPYKQALLKQAGYDFSIDAANLAEEQFIQPSVADTVRLLADLKARALLPKYSDTDTVLITADVAGEFAGQFLGKPADVAEAQQWLRSYSQQTMLVWCGTSIAWAQTGRVLTDVRSADITFRAIDEAMITKYLATTSPLDKGGALAIEVAEQLGWVDKITGEYDAIIGLSLEFIRRQIPLCA